MKNNNEYLTKEDLQFIYTQKALILLNIVIGCGFIYILANFFTLFTKNVFFIGLLPITVGFAYSAQAIYKRIKFTREYWTKK